MTPNNSTAPTTVQRSVLYAGIGPELAHFDVDVDNATLTRRGSVRVPASVQYAWRHATKPYFYVTSSDHGPGGAAGTSGDTHHLSAFRIDPQTGALQPHGAPVPLRYRPIHMTTDATSDYVLIAYCKPSHFTVHRINSDGTIGAEVKQQSAIDGGIYAHQIRVAPSNTTVILVTRGNDAAGGNPEDPGALKVFKYCNGVLSDEVSIAPNGGFGFGPRHLDFHPSQPWVYVSLERQHQICLLELRDGKLSSAPLFSVDTLADRPNKRPRQLASTVHVHPNGRFVYGGERADATTKVDGQDIFLGGENTLVAYAIDQQTGEPKMIQRINTAGLHPRTFAIDPSGRMLVAGNKSPLLVKDGNNVHSVPASLDVFRIGTDGKLDYVRKYNVDVGDYSMFWSGIVPL